jgi:hypothetical protein
MATLEAETKRSERQAVIASRAKRKQMLPTNNKETS